MVEYMEDIDKKSRKRRREEVKKDAVEDITDVVEKVFYNVEDVFKRKEIERKAKESNGEKGKRIIWRLLKLACISGLVLLVGNFVLANIWLLKTLIKSLFNIN